MHTFPVCLFFYRLLSLLLKRKCAPLTRRSSWPKSICQVGKLIGGKFHVGVAVCWPFDQKCIMTISFVQTQSEWRSHQFIQAETCPLNGTRVSANETNSVHSRYGHENQVKWIPLALHRFTIPATLPQGGSMYALLTQNLISRGRLSTSDRDLNQRFRVHQLATLFPRALKFVTNNSQLWKRNKGD